MWFISIVFFRLSPFISTWGILGEFIKEIRELEGKRETAYICIYIYIYTRNYVRNLEYK